MDLPEDPLTWDPQQVSCWLKATFKFTEDTLGLFIQNDVDGNILLSEMDHEALKNEFGIASFGKRCNILKQIQALRGQVIHTRSLPTGSPSTTISRNMDSLRLSVAASTPMTTSSRMSSPITKNSSVRPSQWGHRDRQLTSEDPEEIHLLAQPLRLWFNEEPPVHRQPPVPRKESNTQNRKPSPHIYGEDESGVDIESSDDANDDADDDDDGGDNDVDEGDSSTGGIDYGEATQDPDGHGHNSLDEEDEPLAKKLLERKENVPLAKRILQREKLRQHTSIHPSPPGPSKLTPQPQPSGSESCSGSRLNSESSATKKRVAPVLITPGVASSSTTQRLSQPPPPSTLSAQLSGTRPLTKDSGSKTVTRKDCKMESQLAKIGLSLQDIFFKKDGSAFSSDDDDNWTVIKPRTVRAKESLLYREAVQTNMRRILRTPPIFEVPGHIVYAPVRKLSHEDVPVRVLSVTQAEDNVSVKNSTWDSIFRHSHKDSIPQEATLRTTVPQMITINIGEQDLTCINFGALTKGPNHTSSSVHWSGNKDDIIYPLYGDSDASEYTTDEELYNEVSKEDKERERKKSGRNKISISRVSLSSDAVKEIARIYISDRKEIWTRVERPKLSRTARKMVKNIGSEDHKQKYIDQLKANITTLSQKRLVSLLEAMTETTYRNATEVRKGCKSLDETIDLLCHEQWKHDILCGTEQIPDDQENSGSGTRPSPITSTARQKSLQGPTSAMGSDEVASASEADEEAEERRQRELDAAFIDDTDVAYGSYADVDDYKSDDADGDISMEERTIAKPRRSAEMPSSSSSRAAKPKSATQDSRNFSETPDSLSLPTPPFTATSPQAPPPLSDLDITADDAERSGNGSDDSAPTSARHHKAKKIRTATQAPSPILIDLDDNDLELETRSTLSSKLSSKIKSTPSKPRFKAPQSIVKQEPVKGAVAPRRRLDNSDDASESGRAQSMSNSGNRVPPQEAETIPKSLVTAATSQEDGDDSDEADIPQPATNIKLMKRPNWREDLKAFGMTDGQLITKLREIGKSAHLGLNIADEEPYISVWQEYIEWIELDGGDSIGIKEFLAWKDEGNTTKIYRERAREAAKAQAALEKVAALKAKIEKKLQKEQEEHEKKARAQKEEKERASQKPLSGELEDSFSGSEEPRRRSGGKGKSAVRRPTGAHPEAITIDSSDTDSYEDRSRSSSRSKTKPSSGFKQRRPKQSQSESEGERDARSESVSDKESSDSEGQGLGKNLKKRARAVRNRFDDESSDNSSDDERVNAASQVRPRPKRRVLQARDEAQDVLLLRQNAVKNELEYQKRIKDQEQRAKIRGAVNPLLDDEILINPGHKKTERAVVIPSFLAVNLKPHQIDGLRFMWKNIVMFDGGCILAHSMGLGKTFQVVAFIYVLLTEIHSGNKDIPEKLQPGRVLLLMPPIVLQNWVDEFDKWIPPKHRNDVNVFRLVANNSNMQDRMAVLEKWHADGGVFLVGYTMFRELSSSTKNNTLRNENTAKRFKELLLSPGPSLIFADEGHNIKNKKAKLSVAAKEIKSTARVILTGYPLQNRLEEYWCMVDFVRPKFLDDLTTFRFNYIRPISDGLHIDSTDFEKKIASKKLKVLTELIKNFVMRKDQSILRASLPKKYEFVISCRLSKWQYHLYTQILPTFGGSGAGAVLGNGHLLLTICNHPAAFKAATKDIFNKRVITPVKTTSAVNSPPIAPSTAGGAITILDESDEEPGDKEEKMVEALSQNKDLSQGTWFNDVHKNNVTDVSHGHKVKIVIDIIRACRAIGEKVLVFSRSIPTLDYLEYVTKLAGFKSLMLDGSTPIPDRQLMINDFNARDTYDLFLISSGAGSQGVNLVSASRVIIFDVGWNPSHDEQAIARAFRYGQTRKVFVYRLQTFGTWEDKLYKTNLHKLGLSNRVVDKKNIHQAHSKTEMKTYFEPPPAPESNPRWATEENITALFDKPDADDAVLRSVIQDNSDTITHIVPQSELVREVDSDLSEADMIDIHRMIAEEERRIKWAEEHPGVPIPILQTPGLGTTVRPGHLGSPMQAEGSAPLPAMGTFTPTNSNGGHQPRTKYPFSPSQSVPGRLQTIPMAMLSPTVGQETPQRYPLSMPILANAAGWSTPSTGFQPPHLNRVVQPGNFGGDPNHPLIGNNALGITMNGGQIPPLHQPPASSAQANHILNGQQNQHQQVGSPPYESLRIKEYKGPQAHGLRQGQRHTGSSHPQQTPIVRPDSIVATSAAAATTVATSSPVAPAPIDLPMDSFRSVIQMIRNGQKDPRGAKQ